MSSIILAGLCITSKFDVVEYLLWGADIQVDVILVGLRNLRSSLRAEVKDREFKKDEPGCVCVLSMYVGMRRDRVDTLFYYYSKSSQNVDKSLVLPAEKVRDGVDAAGSPLSALRFEPVYAHERRTRERRKATLSTDSHKI